MRIGIDCFGDVELRSIIASEGRIGDCDVTGQKGVPIYDTIIDNNCIDLSAYLVEILDVYTPESELPIDFPKDNLEWIENVLATDWSIFNLPVEKIKNVVIEICKDTYTEEALLFKEKVGIEKLNQPDFLMRNSIMRESTWECFVKSIKNQNRFHSNHINLELLEEVFRSQNMQLFIPKGTPGFYRARINEGKVLKKREMGPPPCKLATAGRANSQGIQCLYLAGDVITTLHEIRARDLDCVSVAEFVAKKDLKIVDLSNVDKISPFSSGTFEYEWFAINMKILKKIGNEMAKPLRRQDSDIDYLPTQYIADYVKSLGYDGICYRSTLNSEGINYAVFDHKKFYCVKVETYQISSLIYETVPAISR